ncbi:MAG TPA: PIG-L family deacetylase [Candidatus Limnocylindria bacterium]|jgi:N-acetyl-1-D-myo-inositol-2-amino-2-deoxy-alpha-D-glucopyranoside deacetylase|nr:PIG-L family deacetylase [Candidatus Limnocylindria bacterium]
MADQPTLLTVHAHPDDESISTGGVMARYAAEGARVVCVTCTGGEHGEIVVPELDTPANHARLAEMRAGELSRALARLGPIEQRWLGYVDSGMMGTPENDAPGSFWQADFDEAVTRLLAIVHELQPAVMVSYNDFGSYGHPDHIRAALVTKACFERAAELPAPPLKLYETAMAFGRRDEVRTRAKERGVDDWWEPSPDETEEQRREREEHLARMAAAQGPVTTVVDVRDWIGAKHAAMAEHVTQLAQDGFFLALTADDWRELLPTEDFTLRVARLGRDLREVRIPEDDLFAGLR